MRPFFLLCSLTVVAFAADEPAFTPMLDEKLSQWEKWLGVPHRSYEVPGYTRGATAKEDPALGLNRDPLNVYTAKLVDGEVEVIDRSGDDRTWIVAYLVDDGPVQYWLWDRDTQQGRYVFLNATVAVECCQAAKAMSSDPLWTEYVELGSCHPPDWGSPCLELLTRGAEDNTESGMARAALAGLGPDLRAALDLAAARIRAFHERQKPQGNDAVDDAGVRTGVRWSPVDAAGLYVPGGRAAYPSSVLMNAVPAVVAGVRDLIMVTPTPDGMVNPLVLAAARVARHRAAVAAAVLSCSL